MRTTQWVNSVQIADSAMKDSRIAHTGRQLLMQINWIRVHEREREHLLREYLCIAEPNNKMNKLSDKAFSRKRTIEIVNKFSNSLILPLFFVFSVRCQAPTFTCRLILKKEKKASKPICRIRVAAKKKRQVLYRKMEQDNNDKCLKFYASERQTKFITSQ